MDYRLFIYIFLGILPAFVWLLYYLKKDLHPEPKRMILKIFTLGVFITLPTLLVQLGLTTLLTDIHINGVLKAFIYWVFVIALVEEFFKYFVVREGVFHSNHLDEPVDLMIYMIVSALGFAAIENILYLFSPVDGLSFSQVLNNALAISFIRFIGATFLHTLCSGLLGYFIAVSQYETRKKIRFFLIGILLAAILHGVYNFSIIELQGPYQIIVPVTILIGLAVFVMWAFKKVRKMKSVGKV